MKKFSLNKKIILGLLLVVIIFVMFSVLPVSAQEAVNEVATTEKESTFNGLEIIIVYVMYFVAWGGGLLIGLLIDLMVLVANYNDFLTQPVVVHGWVIIRDIANNFFIIILLAISVGTILRVPNYHYKQLLPKLLIMAVLINFSKLFTGVMIDASQIVMLSFASSLDQIESGNILHYMLGMKGEQFKLLSGENTKLYVGAADLFAGLLVAIVATVVSVVVLSMVVVVLIYRIVMLLFLVILSPLAYLATVWPRTKSYADRWWGELFKYLIVGPAMVFFIFLSIFTMSYMAQNGGPQLPESNDGSAKVSTTQKRTGAEASVSRLGSPKGLFNFMLAIGLMIGSLVVAQEMGGAGAKFGSAGINRLKKMGKGATMKTAGRAVGFKKDAQGNNRWSLGNVGFGSAGFIGSGLNAGDKALTGGRVGKVLNTTKDGFVGAVKTGAAGAAVGSVFGPVGTAIGGTAGVLLGSLGGAWGKKLKTRFDNYSRQQNELSTASAADDKGDLIDKDNKGVKIETDANGNMTHINGEQVTDQNREELLLKIHGTFDAQAGGYKEINPLENADSIRTLAGLTAAIASAGTKNNMEDEVGAIESVTSYDDDGVGLDPRVISKVNSSGGDFFDDSVVKQAELEVIAEIRESYGETPELIKDEDGSVVHRSKAYRDPISNLSHQQISPGGNYYVVNGSGQFIDEKGKVVADPGANLDRLQDSGKKTMGARRRMFTDSWAASRIKTDTMTDSIEAGRVEEEQKIYQNLSTSALANILKTTVDERKKMAIAMTLAIKNGFSDAGLVNQSRELFQGNKMLTKKFNDEMNNKNVVLNNTNSRGDINESEVIRLLSEGKVKWSDQDTSHMTAKGFELMARQTGVKFHSELEKMARTEKDKQNIVGKLRNGLDSRGFTGYDLQIRKSFGALSGDFITAFEKGGELAADKLEEALRKIPKAEVFSNIKLEHLDLSKAATNSSIATFQKLLGKALDISMVGKMANSTDVGPDMFKKFINIIERNNTALHTKLQGNDRYKDYL